MPKNITPKTKIAKNDEPHRLATTQQEWTDLEALGTATWGRGLDGPCAERLAVAHKAIPETSKPRKLSILNLGELRL